MGEGIIFSKWLEMYEFVWVDIVMCIEGFEVFIHDNTILGWC